MEFPQGILPKKRDYIMGGGKFIVPIQRRW